MVSNLAQTDEGPELVHQLSSPYPLYSREETEQKIQHALKDSGPHTCKSIEGIDGKQWCEECSFRGKVTSPIVLGRVPWQPSDRLLSTKPPEIRWLIEGLLPKQSVILLGARESSMKTWLALDWVSAIAQGKAWNTQQCNQGRVLYLDAEMPDDLFRCRLQAVGIPANLEIWRWHDHYWPASLIDWRLVLAFKSVRPHCSGYLKAVHGEPQ